MTTIVGILAKLVAGDAWTDQERADAYAELYRWGHGAGAETIDQAAVQPDLDALVTAAGPALVRTQ